MVKPNGRMRLESCAKAYCVMAPRTVDPARARIGCQRPINRILQQSVARSRIKSVLLGARVRYWHFSDVAGQTDDVGSSG